MCHCHVKKVPVLFVIRKFIRLRVFFRRRLVLSGISSLVGTLVVASLLKKGLCKEGSCNYFEVLHSPLERIRGSQNTWPKECSMTRKQKNEDTKNSVYVSCVWSRDLDFRCICCYLPSLRLRNAFTLHFLSFFSVKKSKQCKRCKEILSDIHHHHLLLTFLSECTFTYVLIIHKQTLPLLLRRFIVYYYGLFVFLLLSCLFLLLSSNVIVVASQRNKQI